MSGGLIPAEDSFEAEAQEDDGAHAIASVLQDDDTDAEDAEDDRPLEAAIRRVLDQPEEAAERARRGRERVEREFIRDELARRMAAFIERMIR